MIKIGKSFRWEMGHRLPDHPGGCRNLHGHSYRLQVEVAGQPAQDGMVMDYDDISRVVKPLLAKWDHAFMCHDRDGQLLAFLEEQGMKHIVIPFPSTVENLCRLVRERIQPAFAERSNVSWFAIRVQETESSFAELTIRLAGPPENIHGGDWI
jgi:6-pyruvoyltetrahydropterin/6-carboxytetrahydropterin synthase